MLNVAPCPYGCYTSECITTASNLLRWDCAGYSCGVVMGAELNSDGGVLCVSTVRTREVAKVCDGVHFWVRSRN
jgi:hypothetical protein